MNESTNRKMEMEEIRYMFGGSLGDKGMHLVHASRTSLTHLYFRSLKVA